MRSHKITGGSGDNWKRLARSAAEPLAGHAAEIRKSWRSRLNQFGLNRPGLDALSGLDLAALVRHAQSKNFEEELARQGRQLAGLGVPLWATSTAIGLYIETCLPCLPATDGSGEAATALVQFAVACQKRLLTGYERQQSSEAEALQAEFSRAEERLQALSANLGETYERERRRLARDLHDEIGHDLIVLKLYLEVVALDLKKSGAPRSHPKLKEALTVVQHALNSVRRLTFDLGPAVWREQGFLPALRHYADHFAKQTGIKVRIDSQRLRRELPASFETAFYNVLQTVASGAAARGGARGIRVALATEPKFAVMRIQADGSALAGNRTLRSDPAVAIRSIQDRIELLGGEVEFSSVRSRAGQGRGRIEVRLPMQSGSLA
jgi:signal transduction histidine kinase